MSGAVQPSAGPAAVSPNMGMAMQSGVIAPAASLVPAPKNPVGSMEALYALMAESTATQQKNGKVDVEAKFTEKRAALEKYMAELKKADEDAKADQTWGVLAKVGMVVAAVAATVATYGAAGPVVVCVALALSAGGMLVNETKCFGDDASPWIGAGLMIAGSIVSGGAGGAGAASSVATCASSSATIAQGAQTTVDAVHAHDADLDMREAKAAQQQMRRIQDAIDDIIVKLEDAKQSHDRKAEVANNIVQTQGETLVIAAGAGARA